MTPHAILVTAILLGAFVSTAGIYGVLFCLLSIWAEARLRSAIYAAYASMCATAGAIVAFTPLHVGWKLLVAVSCAAYVVIPPITLRHLARLHRKERTVPS